MTVFNSVARFETKDFKEHCKEHANFLCVKCGKCVTSALRLAQHENKAHSKEAGTGAHAKDAGTRAQDSMCEKCGKIFQSTHALRSHIRGTHSEFKCWPVEMLLKLVLKCTICRWTSIHL